MSSAPAVLLLAVALAVGGAACASDAAGDADLASLRSELERSHEERDELAGRIATLEEELSDVGDGDDTTPLDALEGSLDELEARLEALEGSSTTAEEARAQAEAVADAAASDLRATLDDVRGSAEAVRGEVEELRVLYETLRDRLDRQQR